MKIIYDNESHGYIITFEDIDKLLFVNTGDIVKARDCLVEHIIFEFNNALQEQLSESEADEQDEQYDDWCFDCDNCRGGVCTRNSICVGGELWTPKDFEDYLNQY